MNKTFKFLIFYTIAFSLINCKKDEDYQIPLVQTGDVTDITSSGAIFHGKIMSIGNRAILDYGFIWNDSPELSPNNSYIKSLGTTKESETFSAEINSAFVAGKTYFVRTFIKNEESTVYGRAVSFISLGSKAPIITSFSPESATWGDTITITGENFSCKSIENIVLINNIYSKIISSTESEIKAIIPYNLINQQSEITIIISGNKYIAEKKFSLHAPEITEFSPEIGTFRSLIEIKGKYFHPSQTVVKFGEINAEILNVSTSLLKVKVPDNYYSTTGKTKINIAIGELSVSSDKDFELNLQTINNLDPKSCTRGDVITINGQYFNPDIKYNSVYIGNTKGIINSASTTNLQISFPEGLKHGSYPLKIKISGREIESPDSLKFYEPFKQISSFGGKVQAFCFSINGIGYVGGGSSAYNDGFYQYNPYTDVWTKMSKKPQEELFGPTNTATAAKGYVLCRKVLYEYNPTLDEWKKMNPYPGVSYYSQVAFNINNKVYIGTGSSPNTNEFWEYDGISDRWTKKTDYPGGNIASAVGFSINNKGYIMLGYPSNQYIYEYDPITDTWNQKINISQILQGFNNGRSYSVSFVVDNKAYFTCGVELTDQGDVRQYYNDLYQYDPVSNICKRIIDLPAARRGWLVAFSINDKAYIGLGSQNIYTPSGYLSDFWEFDPSKLKP